MDGGKDGGEDGGMDGGPNEVGWAENENAVAFMPKFMANTSGSAC